jgi:hypothetical protein
VQDIDSCALRHGFSIDRSETWMNIIPAEIAPISGIFNEYVSEGNGEEGAVLGCSGTGATLRERRFLVISCIKFCGVGDFLVLWGFCDFGGVW